MTSTTAASADAPDLTLLFDTAPPPQRPLTTLSWDEPGTGRVIASIGNAYVDGTADPTLRIHLILSTVDVASGQPGVTILGRASALTLTAHGLHVAADDLGRLSSPARAALAAALTYPALAAELLEHSPNAPHWSPGAWPNLIAALTDLPVGARAAGLALIAGGYTGTPDDLAALAAAATS